VTKPRDDRARRGVDGPGGPGIRRTVSPRRRLLPPEDVYPVEPWRLVERDFQCGYLAQMETLFAVSNGYLGIRATPEEGHPAVESGTFLNGFYASWPIAYAEEAYGFPTHGQTMLRVPDGTLMKLYVDDEPFGLDVAQILEFERALDLRAGTLDRHVRFETADGRQIVVDTRRFVSLEHRHLAGIVYELRVLEGAVRIVLSSELALPTAPSEEGGADPRRSTQLPGRVFAVEDQRAHELRLVFNLRTCSSGLLLACGADHRVDCDATVDIERAETIEDRGRVVFLSRLEAGQRLRVVKLLAYHHSYRGSRAEPADGGELRFRVNRTLDSALRDGVDSVLDAQRQRLDRFWEGGDVEIEGDPESQQTVRYNLFQIHQATARAEGFGVPAKGLTGLGYDGHYFWDTEIYVLPFLVYTQPHLARMLLLHRHTQLDQARRRACEVGQRGALFPWRTINGEEASAYYAASTAQYHIDADIVYAASRYVAVTGDLEFLAHGYAEIAVETARLWADLGFYSKRRGDAFCIDGVTGPDEYNTVVNNNAYTNLMARHNLLVAIRAVELLGARAPEELRRLRRSTGLEMDELDAWRRAADRMYVPYDEAEGVHLQDDGFLDRRVWDFERTPPDHYPLLLHYHPLVIYRHQVIKQADLVLATFLLPEEFTPEQRRRIFDYYDPLTTGDSSLSVCIQSIMAAELGYHDKAWRYFADAAAMDLGDIGGNVRDGLHIAALGGTWMALVHGFAGLREHAGHLRFRPALPDGWTRMRFRLRVRGQQLEVDVGKETVEYRLLTGPGLRIGHGEERLDLAPGAPVRAPLTPVPGASGAPPDEPGDAGPG
jgi:alpha,alpha-trehalose phosphorylase